MVSKKTGFGLRLKEAFGNATNGVIGRKIGVAENTVGFYVRGRIPDDGVGDRTGVFRHSQNTQIKQKLGEFLE